MSDISNAKAASTATFVTALVFNLIVFAVEIAIFTLIRPYFKAIYEPRTYVPAPDKRIQPLSASILAWPLALYRADYREIKRANGMDAYFFVRFLRMITYTLLPIWLISWAVLLPLTAVNTAVAGKSGLDKYTFGNVATNQQARYAGHLILVFLFTGWICYVIKHEMAHFIITRQKHLVESEHARSVQANTILVTGIPVKYLTQDALYRLFNELPGGVKRIWINRDLKELPDIYERRLDASSKLESAETALLRTATKLRLEKAKTDANPKTDTKSKISTPKKHSHVSHQSHAAEDDVQRPSEDIQRPSQDIQRPSQDIQRPSQDIQRPSSDDVELASAPSVSPIPDSERPTHRLGFLGLWGKKVDSINWARTEIAECTALLDEGRSRISEADERGHADVDVSNDLTEGAEPGEGDVVRGEGTGSAHSSDEHHHHKHDAKLTHRAGTAVKGGVEAVKGRVGLAKGEKGYYPPMNSAFVTFHKQIAAHLAVQVLAHHEPYRMSNKYIEVAPDDVIWSNLNLNPYEQKVRLALSYAATAGLIICWAIPVAFVGVISNIHTVCAKASWLAWICTLPKVVVGIISGILPPVLLAVLMMLLPIVLRLLARFEGIPKYTGLELSLMTRFFIFQVVHSFFIVTLSSGIIAALPQLISNPTSIPNILATNLPSASTFFLTYLVLQGLSGVAGGFLQIIPLIIYYVKLVLLGSTPRSIYNIKYGARNIAWGTTFPGITLLVVITLGYSILSPIINGLACATFFMFYMLYKYLFLYAYQQPYTRDTGGLFFPKAIQHIFVGMYVQQVCLCALFFLARNENNKASAIPEGALMVVLIVFTAGFNVIINNSYGPLLSALPLSLADKTYSAEPEVPADIKDKDPNEKHDHAHDYEREKEKPSGSDHEKAQQQQQIASQGIHASPNPSLARKEAEEAGYGFAHPAASRPQRVVWIPRDEHGVYEVEERGCVEAGVDVSEHGAVMDAKGKVEIFGSPPDLVGA